MQFWHISDKYRIEYTRQEGDIFLEGLFAALSSIMLFSARLESNNTFPHPLSSEKEREYLEKLQNGDKTARDILIKHNLRLVVYIAKKYPNYSDPDELVSVGTLGLIKAINSYSPEKGSQLATYASRCIENEMLMVLRGGKKLKNNVSLYDNIGTDKDGNELSLMDTLATEEDSVYESLEKSYISDNLKKLLSEALNEKERIIISARFSLNGEPRKTQQEVAEELNISRSYVSRLEKSILKKLKDYAISKKMEF